MLKVKFFALFVVLALTACTTVDGQSAKSGKYTNEQLLVSSGNHQELIKLYKQQLLEKDQPDTRIKLVRSYVETSDFESAIFYLKPLIESKNEVSADAYFYYGKAKFGLNEFAQANASLNKAVDLQPNHGEALNLLGVLAAYDGDYQLARERFVQAREMMVDDVKIKNNLAMMDLIEGRYQSAIEKLLPLLSQPTPSPKVKSNLAFAYAKLDMYEQFSQLTADNHFSKSQSRLVFAQLQNIELKAFDGPPEFLSGSELEPFKQ